jgi:hypothetical protein
MYGAGAVYIFVRTDDVTWSQEAYIKSSNTDGEDLFGIGLSLSSDGQTLAVGALKEDSIATGINGDDSNNDAADAGAVYVFIRSVGGVWSHEAYLKASNTDEGDNFGKSVTLTENGNILAVGAPNEEGAHHGINPDESDNNNDESGAVYIFMRDGGVWTQHAYIKSNDSSNEQFFGNALSFSVDGETLAIGADGERNRAGSTYLY